MIQPGMMGYTVILATQEAQAEGLQVQGQTEQFSEILSQNLKINKAADAAQSSSILCHTTCTHTQYTFMIETYHLKDKDYQSE